MIHLSFKSTGGNTVPSTVITGARKLLSETLSSIGCEGTWTMVPVKRVNPKPNKKIYAKRVINGGIECILQPFDGASTWVYHVTPPAVYKPEEVYLRLYDTIEKPLTSLPAPASEVEVKKEVVVGRIYDVTVTKKFDHGVQVSVNGIESKPGIVTIMDMFGVYSTELMDTVHVGDVFKAMAIEMKPLKFSKMDVEWHLAQKQGLWTGVPDSHGHLELGGYSKAFQRMHDVLVWLAELWPEYSASSIPLKKAVDHITAKLIGVYGGTSADPLAVAQIIRALESTKYGQWIETVPGGIVITEFGLGESKALRKHTQNLPPLKPAEQAKPEVKEVKPAPVVQSGSIMFTEEENRRFEADKEAEQFKAFLDIAEIAIDDILSYLEHSGFGEEKGRRFMSRFVMALLRVDLFKKNRDDLVANLAVLSNLVSLDEEVDAFKRVRNRLAQNIEELNQVALGIVKKHGELGNKTTAMIKSLSELVPFAGEEPRSDP